LFTFKGLAIATCCHQKCGWSSFVAKQQLAAVGIDANSFEIIAWISSEPTR
jgi:tRNA:m4X modification enzyme